jgi:ribosomal protein S24E|tara:strand:- start:6466 stop:6933 length:468 start_codon:yes stop_codon:yes gene_type:complete
MDLKITEEKGNPLFNRKEIQFNTKSKVTPSKIEVGKSISEKLSVPIQNIEIKKIAGKFGSNFFDIAAFVYETKEDRMSTEKKPKLIAEEKPKEKVEEKPSHDKEKVDETKEVEEPKTENDNAAEQNPQESKELTTNKNSEPQSGEVNKSEADSKK